MGFDDSKVIDLPDWSDNLRNLYWVIRVQGRIEKTRRKYYRKVEQEKLRLAEMGINQAQILAVCRYYSNFRNHQKLRQLLQENHPQMVFIFPRN